jgi:hypothetical protein
VTAGQGDRCPHELAAPVGKQFLQVRAAPVTRHGHRLLVTTAHDE